MRWILICGVDWPGDDGLEKIFYLIQPQNLLQYIIRLTMCFCFKEKHQKNQIQLYPRIDMAKAQVFSLNQPKSISGSRTIIKPRRPLQLRSVPTSLRQYDQFNSGALRQTVKKQIQISEYEQLISRFKNTKQKWTDPNFKPQQSSWGVNSRPVSWKRVSEIVPNYTFVSDNFTSCDILQGKIGNCYFLSALAGLAEKSHRIINVFPNSQINENGIYMARILHNGVFQQVLVDDYFPVSENGELLGSHPSGGRQIWVMVIQKCWAKLFGSYDAIDGGLPTEVLHAISAAPTFNFRVLKDEAELDSLWNKIVEADSRDYVICCGTQNQRFNRELQKAGLVGGHAYTVLGVYQTPYRVIKLRNPWGNKEWSGRASDSDKNFWSRISPEDQLQMGHSLKDDGIFFMLWEDFAEYFVIVDICYINDNAHYYFHADNFKRFKPICYDIHTSGGELTIIASQKSKRETLISNPNAKMADVTMVLASQNSNNGGLEFQYIDSKFGTRYSELYLNLLNLAQGKYVLCVFIEHMQQSLSTVSIYSESDISFMPSVNILPDDFLHKVYLDHSRKNVECQQILCENPLQWANFDILADKCGIGYSVFHLDPMSTRKFGLEFDQKQYQKNGLELMPPYHNEGKIKLVCQIGEEVIVLCRLKRTQQFIEYFTLPTPKMYRLK